MMNSRGSAMLEMAAVLGALVVFIAMFFAAMYLLYTNIALAYLTEQAALCAMTKTPTEICRRQLVVRVRSWLPTGQLLLASVEKDVAGQIYVRTRWAWGQYHYKIEKKLAARDLLRRRALHW